ncbi:MAG: pyridoxamine 5'-phosphate oxidase family protein [Oscillospiraceae bacterium]|jgi:nitroimidazol reductase NimA-like FMN-containing flavoprotein (pyridoxamine 5'-phosphate oxidase superfamily)|nr:pyridoxamine 5'-phosphate oxidase family protein [Oscillospiraceae bacterium]
MKEKHILPPERQAALLDRVQVGTLATVKPDGSPYAVPVHFVYLGDKIYIHAGPHGQKYENLLQNSRVSFSVWEMAGYGGMDNAEPCKTGTRYESVILSGTARVADDSALKRSVLRAFAEKYTPDKDAGNIPDSAVERTCVIEIMGSRTGKVRQ